MSVPPSEDILKKMLSLGLVGIVDNNYTYSNVFERIVIGMREHPPGKFEQLKMANKLKGEILPVLLAYGTTIMVEGEDQSNLKKFSNIATAAIALERYFKETKLLYDKNDSTNFIYALYYLNTKKVPIESDL